MEESIGYCGLRGQINDVRAVCVGTPWQRSFAMHGVVPAVPIRVINARKDPATGTYIEADAGLPEVPQKTPAEIGIVRLLRKRWDIRAYSREFDWGMESPGNLQLSVALLASYLGDNAIDEVIARHEAFARIVIQSLPRDQWTLTERQMSFYLNVDLQ